ncbi:MAG TPA: class I SAM-dependent methyltransferase [Sphingomicrobium sp.]|jgi:SAM-dependent methyltransferase|nr:class I SAM-dependent methyltransferase [Sphingomicrobium sp.]
MYDNRTRRIDPKTVQDILSPHLALYRKKLPTYQATMLDSMSSIWTGPHSRLLDIGGGTGVIAEAISRLFSVREVHSVDVVDRFCRGLSVTTSQFDGTTLPFEDKSFDAATLNNVMHHVPLAVRTSLLRDVRRVVKGPLYIKDHERRSGADDLRLQALDAIGNIPFSGMVWARYLGRAEWEQLASSSGYRIARRAAPARYRSGAYAMLFPNRLEITMRLDPL